VSSKGFNKSHSMRTLTEAQYQVEAKPILREVFVNDDPFDNTFSPNVAKRLIVYRCGNYIEPDLIEGLIAAASDLGDTHCYLTNLFRDGKKPNDYYISLSELQEEYVSSSCNNVPIEERLDINLWIEYVIYSSQGKWGLMVSHEHHGMLGGSSEFINKIRQSVPNLDTQVGLFLQKFESISSMTGRKFDWLPKLLAHVYGQEKAEKLLKETGLS
jgi:hypothetical protein